MSALLSLAAAAPVEGPKIDWEQISPLVILTGGSIVVLLAGLLRARFVRTALVPLLTVVTFGLTIAFCVALWGGRQTEVIAGALRIDDLTLLLTILFSATGIGAVAMSLRSSAPREASHGEYYFLLLMSVLGMVILAGSNNLVSIFIGYELLSIPLYVLCATEMRRAKSLESGLKYLIVGSVGSATLLYGLALIYGATGSTDLGGISSGLTSEVATDPLLLTGIALALTGLAFKSSVAPFHQWTPDVYEGAPTPITAFMAVATKAAAFGILLRIFDVALINAFDAWSPALAVLAVVTIIVGNVGALTQRSLKRMLAYSSVAQAGYLLVGVVVATRLGASATLFYLAVYLLMNVGAFAVVVARERALPEVGDDIDSLNGLGSTAPVYAWIVTIAMLSLAGFPATAGFFGKIELIRASVDNSYAFLGVAIVLGSAISLAYYLRVVAAVWMKPSARASSDVATVSGRPVMAGGSPEADASSVALGAGGETESPVATERASMEPEIVVVGVLCAAATIFFGLYPGPLFDVARDAASSFSSIL